MQPNSRRICSEQCGFVEGTAALCFPRQDPSSAAKLLRRPGTRAGQGRREAAGGSPGGEATPRSPGRRRVAQDPSTWGAAPGPPRVSTKAGSRRGRGSATAASPCSRTEPEAPRGPRHDPPGPAARRSHLPPPADPVPMGQRIPSPPFEQECRCLPVAQRPAQKLPPKHLCARSRASGAPQALPAVWGCVTPLPVPLARGMRGRDPSACDDPAALTQHGPSSAGPTAPPWERALGRQRRGLHPWAEEGPGGIWAGPAPQRGGEHLCCLWAHSTCLP